MTISACNAQRLENEGVTTSGLFDLHSHTTASDGALSPIELVLRAVSQRVDVLAITDHDTTKGIPAASQAIITHCLPLVLMTGVEISTLWQHLEIHIVGLNFDIEHPALKQLLEEQATRRQMRARAMAFLMEKARIPGVWEGANQIANGADITRGHIARYLVAQGYATEMKRVFKHYLTPGKIGYVPPQWCSMEEAIKVIHMAGGVAVLAHPGRYRLNHKYIKQLLRAFKSGEGDAIEVAQCQQSPGERTQLAAYARQFGLLASQGSDFHQPTAWIDLGRKLSLPEGCMPVWQRGGMRLGKFCNILSNEELS